jgi:multicomponent Na+:H+ antiporter subunit D
MHIFGGCCLLTGIILHVVSQGSITVGPLQGGWAAFFILIGFGLNTAFIPLHTWLPDAYPQGTITGSVFLSVFTTKTGVYALARCFSGTDFLAYMGAIMAVYGILFALLQNDTRKLLSYHIISQVGYMVAGIGIGSPLGVNGGIAHLTNNILYKTLLFMCMGSVIYRTGKEKLTELGGLARLMPITCVTCLIASLSISGAPGFNGFVSKGMVLSSVVEAHQPVLELMLILASVGTFLSFTKLCYFTFFTKNEEIKAKEAPVNMQWAMMFTAFLCIFIGVYPKALFYILPNDPVNYHSYTPSHMVGVLQLFLLSGFVFMLAYRAFSPHPWIVLDFDYFYRMICRGILWMCKGLLNNVRLKVQALLSQGVRSAIRLSKNPMLIIETVLRSTPVKMDRASGQLSVFSEEKGKGYDENLYRNPLGLGVLLAILFLFLYGLIYLMKS